MTRAAVASEDAPRSSVALALAVGVPVSVLFGVLAVRGLDLGRVVDALTAASPAPLAGAVVAMGVVYPVQSERWRRVARHQARASPASVLRLTLSGVAVNNVVPGRPGELLRGLWLSRALGVPRARALATVGVDRASDVLALVLMLCATYPLIDHPAWLTDLVVASLAVAGAIGAVLIAAGVHARRSGGRSTAGRVRTQVVHVLAAAGAVVNRRDAAVIGLLSLVAWSWWALAAWLVAASLGISLSPVEALFMTAMINLGAAIPSSPGFVGTYQWLGVTGLGLFGVAHAPAFAFAVLLQGVWYVPTTVVGLVLFARAGGGWAARAPARRVGQHAV